MPTEGFSPAKYAFMLREVNRAKHDAWNEGMKFAASLLNGEEMVNSFKKDNPYPTYAGMHAAELLEAEDAHESAIGQRVDEQ